MIITIDGPIGTGKSTVAKRLSREIGFIYYDTGAMYRCLTYGILKNGIDVENDKLLKAFLNDFSFEIKVKQGEHFYFIGNEDITKTIRTLEVTGQVSKVSAQAAVRDKLVAYQRELAVGVNGVFEGRDMGTVVFPNAEVKIFLTGDAEVRARRRFEELKKKYPEDSKNLTFTEALANVNRRDEYDTKRELSPLKKAENAYVVDTTNLSIEEVIQKILEYKDNVRQKG